MAQGILGRKIGMTQLFVEDRAVGATVVEARPCTVVQIKTTESDGYNALQLGYGPTKESKATKPLLGHYRKADVAPHRRLFEVRVDHPEEYNVGDVIGVDIFEEGEKIDVAGVSKGLGFQGVVKRWDFAGGPKSHGSHFHRRPGSVGMCVKPGRVMKGKKLPGQTGGRRVTVKGLQVLRVDPERNLLVLKGATPGSRGTILELGKRNG
jgi:large subunit ribosomal protein L3